MKYLYILFFISFAVHSQNKGTLLKYQVYYNFNKPISRDIDLYVGDKSVFSIEKMNTTKKAGDEKKPDDVKPLINDDIKNVPSSNTDIVLDIKWNDKIVSINKLKNELYETVQDIELGNFITIENIPTLNWHILNETKIIKNLKCIKATTTFRGVDWEVWFTNDIPLPYGPWKLQGTPGLIVEVKNKQATIHYLLSEVQFNYKLPELKLPSSKQLPLKEYIKMIDENGNYEYYEDRNTKVVKKSNTRSVIEPIYEWEEEAKK